MCWWRVISLLLTALTAGAGELSDAAIRWSEQSAPDTPAVAGRDGWWFAADELELLARPPETPAPDPAVLALRDFKEQLAQRQIALILLPVPLKAEMESSHWADPKPEGAYAPEFSRAAIRRCAEAAPVVDLSLGMSSEPRFCRTDSHWSPALVELAARECAAAIRALDWYPAMSRTPFPVATEEIGFAGDLATAAGNEAPPERFTVRRIGGEPVRENAPILLIGDSHTLIFSTGKDMLCSGAGLAEQLACETGLPVARLGSRGSEGTAIWQEVMRKELRTPGWLNTKKVVIWCFSVREMARGQEAWRTIPITETTNHRLESQ